jgi:peptidoglycan-N-acetylglucosamine deacetylase
MAKLKALCLTFDNLGQAKSVFDGRASLPDPRAPEVAIAYPNVLGLLRDLGVKATFFVEGWSALHFPHTIEAIISAGHEIGLHGWIHEKFSDLAQPKAVQYISDGTAALNRFGLTPAGFRAPGGVRGSYAADILKQAGYLYDSSVETEFDASACLLETDYSGDSVTALDNGLIAVPWRWSMIDAIHYMISPQGLRNPEALADYWCSMVENAANHGRMTTIIGHAHVSGLEKSRLAALRRVLEHALGVGMEIVTAERAARSCWLRAEQGPK